MKMYVDKPPFGNAKKWLEKHGDDVWSMLCDCCHTDTDYTFWEAAELLVEEARQKKQRGVTVSVRQMERYVRLVIKNVMCEYLIARMGTEKTRDNTCPVRLGRARHFVLVAT